MPPMVSTEEKDSEVKTIFFNSQIIIPITFRHDVDFPKASGRKKEKAIANITVRTPPPVWGVRQQTLPRMYQIVLT